MRNAKLAFFILNLKRFNFLIANSYEQKYFVCHYINYQRLIMITSSELDWLAVFGYLGITLFVMWRIFK